MYQIRLPSSFKSSLGRLESLDKQEFTNFFAQQNTAKKVRLEND
jgi:hypothetical protein